MKYIYPLVIVLFSMTVSAQDMANKLPVEKVMPPENTQKDNQATDESEDLANEVITHGIYQCKIGSKRIFVDEQKRKQFNDCIQIRAPQYRPKPDEVKDNEDATAEPIQNTETSLRPDACSGALLYQGNTYIFSDSEPCPIPASIFEQKKPIEAAPEFYEKKK